MSTMGELRLPVSKAFEFYSILKNTMKNYLVRNSNVKVEISFGGSLLRRFDKKDLPLDQQPTVGDLDVVLITDTGLIPRELKDYFVRNSQPNKDGVFSYIIKAFGVQQANIISNIKGFKGFQIDINSCLVSEYDTMMLTKIGNASFVRCIRGLAKDKGYKLNNKALYKIDPVTNGMTPLSSNAREIFRILNLEWIDPKDRDNDELLREVFKSHYRTQD